MPGTWVRRTYRKCCGRTYHWQLYPTLYPFALTATPVEMDVLHHGQNARCAKSVQRLEKGQLSCCRPRTACCACQCEGCPQHTARTARGVRFTLYQKECKRSKPQSCQFQYRIRVTAECERRWRNSQDLNTSNHGTPPRTLSTRQLRKWLAQLQHTLCCSLSRNQPIRQTSPTPLCAYSLQLWTQMEHHQQQTILHEAAPIQD